MTTKALELAQWGSDLVVDTTTATYDKKFEATSGYNNLPTFFIVFGRNNINTNVPVTNGILSVIGRTETISVGTS